MSKLQIQVKHTIPRLTESNKLYVNLEASLVPEGHFCMPLRALELGNLCTLLLDHSRARPAFLSLTSANMLVFMFKNLKNATLQKVGISRVLRVLENAS